MKVARLYDERFCRMWELYLAGAESSFRDGRMAVMHLQLGHQRDAVPLSREYMAQETERLKERENALGLGESTAATGVTARPAASG